MTPTLYLHHAQGVRRLLRDLDIDPAALLVAPNDFAIVDGVTARRLTPALHNQTLAEGLVAALKLSAAALEGGWFAEARVAEAERKRVPA